MAYFSRTTINHFLVIALISGLITIPQHVSRSDRSEPTPPPLEIFRVITPKPITTIGSRQYQTLLANTYQKRELGLSNKELLPTDQLMLFIFEKNDYHGIWMKDMDFALDILWLDEKKNIITIAENVKPASYPDIYIPSRKDRYVIEMNAGEVKKNKITVGQKVSW